MPAGWSNGLAKLDLALKKLKVGNILVNTPICALVILEFYCDKQSFITEVVAIKLYPSLEAYLAAEGFANALPGVASFNEAVNVWLQYNSREELQQAGGFLAIHVSVVDR